MIVLVPLLAEIFHQDSGSGLLASSLILGLMILPTVTSLTKNALESVPESYTEGSLAMGATKEQTIFKVILPAAKTGILSALTLGAGRAIGETMAVLMVCGSTPNFPSELFLPIRTLTVNIVSQMGYAQDLHREALFATGFVLLVFILILNGVLAFIKRTRKVKGGADKRVRVLRQNSSGEVRYKVCGLVPKILSVVCKVIAALVVSVLVILIGYILAKGLPHLSFDFLFGESTYSKVTLQGAFISTGWIILISLLVAVPIGTANGDFPRGIYQTRLQNRKGPARLYRYVIGDSVHCIRIVRHDHILRERGFPVGGCTYSGFNDFAHDYPFGGGKPFGRPEFHARGVSGARRF